MTNPTYDKLRQAIEDGLAGTELNQLRMNRLLATQVARVALDSIWPEIEKIEEEAFTRGQENMLETGYVLPG